VLLQLVSKELLTSYRDHFGDLDVMGTVRFVATQAVETVIERTAARTLIQRLVDAAGRDEDAEWSDRGWRISLFDYREKHLLDGLARRMRTAAQADDPFAVFNATQDHMLATARAHVERVLLEAFIGGIDSCPDESAKQTARSAAQPHHQRTMRVAAAARHNPRGRLRIQRGLGGSAPSALRVALTVWCKRTRTGDNPSTPQWRSDCPSS
jgi:hypothetical protein